MPGSGFPLANSAKAKKRQTKARIRQIGEVIRDQIEGLSLLFMTERLNGVQQRGSSGRVESEDDADADRNAK